MKSRKILKFFLIILTFTILLLFINTTVKASTDTIDSIDITIEVSDDATATVTEIWKTSLYSGTELYKPYTDLYTSEINNLSVTDETGTEYTLLSNWDISASQSEKAHKCGLYTSGDEIDICWGIGEYGSHTYTIKYTISNFVQQYDDYQAIYFTLLPSNIDPSPAKATITLSTTFDIDSSTTTLQGTGFTGTSNIENGKAIFKTTSVFTSSNYMTVYLKFSDSPFRGAEIISNTSDSQMYNGIYETEPIGSTNTISSNDNSSEKKSWTSYIPYVLIVILVVLLIRFIIVNRKNNEPTNL